jgi:NAD(P)-dependent dehydrogenase (short-subunit alcohol dehydrogenase family)
MASAWADKTALITGGGHRIGRAIALSLAKKGVNCVVQSLPQSDASETLDQIRAAGVEAHGIRADFFKAGEAAKIFSILRERKIQVDYLINNASIFEESRLLDIPADRMDATLAVNTFSPFILARDFAKQADTGVILNILDARIGGYDTGHAGYAISKIMLFHLTRMMALECAPGIRVNAVAPGIILPPAGEGPGYLKKIRGRTLLGTHGSIHNITDSVLFLLKNDFITGETLFVDGGENLKRKQYAPSVR